MELSLEAYEEITGTSPLPPVEADGSDRRKHRRMPFGFRATIQPMRKGVEGPPTVVMVRDISLTGIGVLHEEAIKQGTSFVIEFKGSRDRPVKIRCTAVRCEQGGMGGTQYVIGATFDELLTKEFPPLPKEQPLPPLSDQARVQGRLIKSDAELGKKAAPPTAADAVAKTPHAPTAPATAAAAPKPEPVKPPSDQTRHLGGSAKSDAEKERKAAPSTAAPSTAAPSTSVPATASTATPPSDAQSEALATFLEELASTRQVSENPPSDQTRILDRLVNSDTETEKKPAPATAVPTAHASESEPAANALPKDEAVNSPSDQARILERLTQTNSEAQTKRVPLAASGNGSAATPIFSTRSPAKPVKEMSIVRDTEAGAEPAIARNHEVVAGVKSLLLRQKETLKKQAHEIEALRGELAQLKRKVTQLQAKADADDKAIAELAAILAKEAGEVGPDAKGSVAA
ncbi:MAG: PilZ domain-containing protein [Tepidisphaeraceae bacterium]